MDVKSPLLVNESQPTDDTWWITRWIPCGRHGPRVLTNAQTVQRLMDMKLTLAMTRDRSKEDYERKAAEVAALMRKGQKKQAYESMKTAKQYRQDWETRHAMWETVERIKSRLIAQQQNMALFASFAEANTALARMLEEVPLDRVEAVLDEINDRMTETHEVSTSLASPAASMAEQVDDDELNQFLADNRPQVAEEPALKPSTVVQQTAASRMIME
jgi:hypothetical protein